MVKLEKEFVLKAEIVPITSIRPYIRNSRKNDLTIDSVAVSIRQFGFQQPIVVDQNMTIVAGHSRWYAARKLGLEQVPICVFRGSDKEARYYRLLDNRSQENSDWDFDLLREELRRIPIDIETGFDDLEIAKILGESSTKLEAAKKTVFEVVVEVEDEQQQNTLYEYIEKELGKPCRILSI
jgi:ParB-like chromosome segregation protein Spo0J